MPNVYLQRQYRTGLGGMVSEIDFFCAISIAARLFPVQPQGHAAPV